MITLSNISKIYQGKGVSATALADVSLTVDRGDFVIIYGKSGCGKSTLLNILGTMDRPTGGSYYFDDTDVCSLKFSDLSRFRNRHIGFIFQSFYLINELTALDNVGMPLGYAGAGKSERSKRAGELLKMVGLEDKMKNKPFQLSGGEQQRVAIARSLVAGPGLVLADEPTGNLDERTTVEIMDLLKRINENGTTIIMVTHNPDLAHYADRVVRMSDGRIVATRPVTVP